MGSQYSIKAVIRAVDKFSPSMMRMAASMDHFGKQAQRIGQGMTTNLSLPIAAFGGLTLKTAVGFESAMNKVEALSGETGDSLKAMRDMAQSLGSTTAFSASEAASAMGFLAQSGWKANKILEGTPALLDLASASSTSLSRTADITSNIMGQFRISASNASRVADVLSAATASANVDMEMLAESFKYAGPVANKFGLSLEDTSAVIGLLGNVGIQGSNAGTALKNTMLALVNPAGEAGKMLDYMGVKTRDAKGNMLPLAQVLSDFGSKMAGLGEGDQLRAIDTLFSKISLAGATELISQAQTGELQKYAEALANVDGRARSMAATMMKGAPKAVKDFSSAFEGLMLSIANSGLLQWFTEIANKMTALVRQLSETNPEMLRMGTIVAGVAAIAGPTIWAIGGMASGIASLAKAFGILKVVVLSNPLVALAATAAAAAYIIYDNWDGIVQWLTDKFEAIRSAFGDGLMSGLFQMAKELNPFTVLFEAADGLVSYLTGIDLSGLLMDQISSAINGLPDWAKDLIGISAEPGAKPRAAAQGNERGRLTSAMGAGQSAPRDARAKVDVNFSNLPPGARVESETKGDGLDLGLGRGYAFSRPK